MFYDVSQCVSWCFTMFNKVLWCLTSRATIGVVDRLRDHDNAAGIGNNLTEIGDGAAGIVDIAANMIPC